MATTPDRLGVGLAGSYLEVATVGPGGSFRTEHPFPVEVAVSESRSVATTSASRAGAQRLRTAWTCSTGTSIGGTASTRTVVNSLTGPPSICQVPRQWVSTATCMSPDLG